MSNPFGGFVHTSPISSPHHDPLHTITSNILRDYFGPTVQSIGDCLLRRTCTGSLHSPSNTLDIESPGHSFREIETTFQQICQRPYNEERHLLVQHCNRKNKKQVGIHMAKGPESSGYVVDPMTIRAALLVLIQHSIVVVLSHEDEKSSKSKNRYEKYRYKLDPNRARYIPRYPRFVEHVKDAIDENAGAVMEEILLQGRMRAEDVVTMTMESVYRYLSAGRDDDDDKKGDNEDEVNDSESKLEGMSEKEKSECMNKQKEKLEQNKELELAEKNEIRVGVLKSFKKLVEGGYLEQVESIQISPQIGDDENSAPPKKKAKLESEPVDDLLDTDDEMDTTPPQKSDETVDDYEHDLSPGRGIPHDDPNTLQLLRKQPYQRLFPVGSVWRINIPMCHSMLRALTLGNLIQERYQEKIPAAGSIITAALKFQSQQNYAPNFHATNPNEEKGIFTAEQLMDYIPTPVLHAFQNKAGGGKSNIHNALVQLSQQDWPQVVMEAEGGRFELATRQMVKYVQGRILHQVVKDNMGDIAARICSLLEVKGCMETDSIAKSAMVPVQDVREVSCDKYFIR